MNLIAALFTLPTSGEILSGLASYTTTFWADLLPLALMAIGIIVGVLVVSWVMAKIGGALRSFFAKKRSKRGRGRR